MSNTNSTLFTIGSALGKAGAYAFEGTRLASTQLALGAQAGYAEKAEQLRAQRLALSAPPPVAAPRQKKLATAS